jgi:hypothetical protein
MITKRYFLVGLRGRWAQLRVAMRAPARREYVSTARMTVSEPRIGPATPSNPYGEVYYIDVERPMALKQIVYEGGVTLATLPTEHLIPLIGIDLNQDIMIELLPDQVEKLMKEIKRGKSKRAA